MPRVVVHEIVIGAGAALLLVAVLATAVTQRSLQRHERAAVLLRGELDSLAAAGWQGGEAVSEVAGRLERAEFEVRATRELRARLWRPGGMGLIAAIGGLLVLVAGTGVWWWSRAVGRS